MASDQSSGTSFESILAIAAHPDDIELSCAGTLMMEKMHGKKAFIADLTRGELGTRGTDEIRAAEAALASEIMEIDARENVGLPDGFLRDDQPSLLAVIKVIRRYKPSILLTNAPEDRHPDHGRAAHLVKTAAFLSGLVKIETKDAGVPQEKWRPAYVFHFIQDRYLKPSFVYDITPVMDRKIAAIKAFRSQFDTSPDNEPQTYISTPEFLQSIVDRSRMFGKMIGVPYAEGFIADKTLGINGFASLIQNIT